MKFLKKYVCKNTFCTLQEFEVLPSNVSFPLTEILSDGSTSLETESDLRLIVEDPQPSTSTAASIEPCAGLESTNSNTQDLQQLLESSGTTSSGAHNLY